MKLTIMSLISIETFADNRTDYALASISLRPNYRSYIGFPSMLVFNSPVSPPRVLGFFH